MKTKILSLGLAGLLACATGAAAITYYVNDTSAVGDVYCTQLGNDANDGRTPSTPKLTLNNLLASTNLLPGDVVLIDTGTYTNTVDIGTNVNGTVGNRILFQGASITNTAASGTIFMPPATNHAFNVNGNYLQFRDIKTVGGARGMQLNNSSFGEYERVLCIETSGNPLYVDGASNSNAFRHCAFATTAYASAMNLTSGKGNYIEHCVICLPRGTPLWAVGNAVSNVANSIIMGDPVLYSGATTPNAGTRNLLYSTNVIHGEYETLAELQRVNTNWYGNTVADPRFVNLSAYDFHLLSAAGFVSNGVWVTNAAVGFSPGIDFGPRE